jgi:hypothetical protein
MSSFSERWGSFVQQLNQYETTSKVDLLRICLDFRLSLTEYLKEQAIAGSSEDLVNLLTNLDGLSPLPLNVQFLQQIEGINIALVDYSRLLHKQDNDSWRLIHSELSHTTGLLNQLTSLIARKLYSSAEERLTNRVSNSSQSEEDAVRRFANKLLDEIRQIKSDLELLNAAIENEAPTASEQFMEFWTDPAKAKLACSLLVDDEALCMLCFDNYKNFFLQFIKQIEESQPLEKSALNVNFLSFFAKQQSLSLIQKSKNRFLQSEENIILLRHRESEIEKTEALGRIAENLNALGLNYKSSFISCLVNTILKIILGGCYDSRSQTVREAQELRDIIYYLEENDMSSVPSMSSVA